MVLLLLVELEVGLVKVLRPQVVLVVQVYNILQTEIVITMLVVVEVPQILQVVIMEQQVVMVVSVEEVAVLPVVQEALVVKLVDLVEEVQEMVVVEVQQVIHHPKLWLTEVLVALTLVVVAVVLLDGQVTETGLEEQVDLELL